MLELLARELSTREVAHRLGITAVGVRVHTTSIVKKFGARDRTEVIEMFRRHRPE